MVKLEALEILKDTIEASISSSEPHKALEKLLKGAARIDNNNVSVAAFNRRLVSA